LEFYIFFAVASLVFTLIAVLIMTSAALKFKTGKVRSFLLWLLGAFYFMAIPYTAFILRDTSLVPAYDTEISYFIYICMTVVSLCLITAAFKLRKFAKTFSF